VLSCRDSTDILALRGEHNVGVSGFNSSSTERTGRRSGWDGTPMNAALSERGTGVVLFHGYTLSLEDIDGGTGVLLVSFIISAESMA
jgi:hypothetical protein